MRSALDIFRSNIKSVIELHALHEQFSKLLPALDLNEILRSEYVLVISALDRYLHDIVREHLLNIDLSKMALDNITSQKEYPISLFTVKSLLEEPDETTKKQLIATDLKKSLEKISFQSSSSVESALRLIGCKKIWKSLGIKLSKTSDDAKRTLDIMIRRRNIIAHQADISNENTLEKNEINRADVDEEITFIVSLVESINQII